MCCRRGGRTQPIQYPSPKASQSRNYKLSNIQCLVEKWAVLQQQMRINCLQTEVRESGLPSLRSGDPRVGVPSKIPQNPLRLRRDGFLFSGGPLSALSAPRKTKNPRLHRGFCVVLAERAGFEPAIQFPVYTLSRRAPSTTRTPLLGGF